MKPLALRPSYRRDEELIKFTLLLRDRQDVVRYSERKETAEQLSSRVNPSSI